VNNYSRHGGNLRKKIMFAFRSVRERYSLVQYFLDYAMTRKSGDFSTRNDFVRRPLPRMMLVIEDIRSQRSNESAASFQLKIPPACGNTNSPHPTCLRVIRSFLNLLVFRTHYKHFGG
jgi:hypothetical protein